MSMFSLGEFGFSLALQGTEFFSQLAGAGQKVAGFAATSTKAFAGSQQQFAAYSKSVAAMREVLVKQQAESAAYTAELKKQQDASSELGRQIDQLTDDIRACQSMNALGVEQIEKYTASTRASVAEIKKNEAAIQLEKKAVIENAAARAKAVIDANAADKTYRSLLAQRRSVTDQTSQQWKDLTAEAKKYLDEYKKLFAEKKRLGALITSSPSRITEYQSNIDSARKNISNTLPEIKREVQVRKSNDASIAGYEARQTALKSERVDAHLAATQVQGSLASANISVKDTETKLTALEAQAKAMPGVVARNLDSFNASMTQTRDSLGSIGDTFQAFNRKVERNPISRWMRGVSDEMIQAKEKVYRLQDAIKNNDKAVATAEAVYKKYGESIKITQSEITEGEARIAEKRAAIDTQQKKIELAERSAAEARLNGDVLAIAMLESRVEREKATKGRMEADLQTSITAQGRRNALLVETNNRLNQQAGYVQKLKDSNIARNTSLKQAKDAVQTLTEKEERAKAATEGHTEAVAKQKDPINELIKGWLGLGDKTKTAQETGSKAVKGQTAAVKEQGQALTDSGRGWFSWLGFGTKARDVQDAGAKALNGNTAALKAQRQALAEGERGLTSWTAKVETARSGIIQFFRDVAVIAVGAKIGQMLPNPGEMLAKGKQNVKDFETMMFSMNALLAKDYRTNVDSSLNMDQALATTKAQAKEIVEVLEQLGLNSTFTSEQLVGVFTKLKQNFSADETMRITNALSSFGDANGKTADDLEGVAVALGKIQTKGKLSGEEIDMLSERGVVALDYLATAYGKTKGEITDMISKGEILAEDAIPVIISAIEKDFGGAGQAAGQTFKGLSSSIEDLGARTLRNVLTPALEAVKPLLQGFITILSNESLLKGVQSFGEMVGTNVAGVITSITDTLPLVTGILTDPSFLGGIQAFGAMIVSNLATIAKGLIDAVGLTFGVLTDPVILSTIQGFGATLGSGLQAAGTVVADFGTMVGSTVSGIVGGFTDALPAAMDYIQGFVDSFFEVMGSLSTFGESMWEWGNTIVQSFIEGMLNGVDSIMSVVDMIGSTLSEWLQPHSPPKVAPEIDQWGKGTSQVYLDSMAGADAGGAMKQIGASLTAMPGISAPIFGGLPTTGGTADGGLATTNSILTYIAKLMETMVSASASKGRGGSTKDVTDVTSEEFRQKMEKDLGGKGGGSGKGKSKEELEVEKQIDAEIALAKQKGDTAKVMELLQQKQSKYTEGSSEYLAIEKQILATKQGVEKSELKIATAAEKKEEAARKTNLAASKRKAADQKATEDAQVRLLVGQGKFNDAIAILERRLAKTTKGSKDYFATQAQIEAIRKKDKTGKGAKPKPGEAGAAGGEAGGADSEAPASALSERIKKIRDQVSGIVKGIKDSWSVASKWMSDFAAKVQVAFEASKAWVMGIVKGIKDALGWLPTWVTDIFKTIQAGLGNVGGVISSTVGGIKGALGGAGAAVKGNQTAIGFVLAGLALRIATVFGETKVVPLLQNFGAALKNIGSTALSMVTPLNIIKVAIGLFALAWAKDFYGLHTVMDDLIKKVKPNIDFLQKLFNTFMSPKTGTLEERFNALVAELPNIQIHLRTIFETFANGLTGWFDPLQNDIKKSFEKWTNIIVKFLKGGIFKKILDQVKIVFADIRRWLSGQEPQTFMIGVVAKVLSNIAGSTAAIFAGVGAMTLGLITAYGPTLQLWGEKLVDWVVKALPAALRGIGVLITATAGALLSGAMELARPLGKLTIRLAGWILPAIPPILQALGEMILTAGTWLLSDGIPRLASVAADWLVEFVNTIADNGPMAAFNLAQAVGSLITEAVAGIGLVLLSVAVWGPKVKTWVTDTFIPLTKTAAIGAGRILFGLAAGLLTGILTPIVDVVKTGIAVESLITWIRGFGIESVNSFLDALQTQFQTIKTEFGVTFRRFIDWIRSFGIEFVNNFLDSVRMQLSLRDAVTAFDAWVKGVTMFLGASLGLGDPMDRLVDRINGVKLGFDALPPHIQNVMKVLTALTGAIMTVCTWNTIMAIKNGVVMMSFGPLGRAVVQAAASLIGLKLEMSAISGVDTWTSVNGGLASGVTALKAFGAACITNARAALISLWGALTNPAAWASYIASTWTAAWATIAAWTAALWPILLVAAAIGALWAAWEWRSRSINEATASFLGKQSYWNDATRALNAYANATDEVKERSGKAARALDLTKTTLETLQKEIEDKKGSWWKWLPWDNTDAQIKELETTIATLKDELVQGTKDLNSDMNGVGIAGRDALVTGSAEAYGQTLRLTAKAVGDITEDTVATMVQDIREAYIAGAQALGDLTTFETDSAATATKNLEEHDTKIKKLQFEAATQRQTNLRGAEKASKAEQDARAAVVKTQAKINALDAAMRRETNADKKQELKNQLDQEVTARTTQREALLQAEIDNKAAIKAVESKAHLDQVNAENEAFKEKQIADAVAYTKEREQRRAALGQQLLDIIRNRAIAMAAANQAAGVAGGNNKAEAKLTTDQENRIAQLTDTVAKEYGVQEDVSAVAMVNIGRSFEQYMNGSVENVDTVISTLKDQQEELRRTRELADKLRTEVITSIVTKYEGRPVADMQAELNQLPQTVEVLMKTRLQNDPAFTALLESGGQLRITTITTPQQPPPIRNLIDPNLTGKRALGGPVKKKGLYEVAESQTGPELLFSRGRTYLMMGEESGMVVPPNRFGRAADHAAAAMSNLTPRRSTMPVDPTMGGQRVSISVPVTISGNTVRSEDDLVALQRSVTSKVVATLDALMLQGMRVK